MLRDSLLSDRPGPFIRHFWREACRPALFKPSIQTFEHIASAFDHAAEHEQALKQAMLGDLGTLTSDKASGVQRAIGSFAARILRTARKNAEKELGRSAAIIFGLFGAAIGGIATVLINWLIVQVLQVTDPIPGSILPGEFVCATSETGFIPDVSHSIPLVISWVAVFGTGFWILTITRNIGARLLGGEGSGFKLAYITAAFYGPATALLGIAITFPYIGVFMPGVRALYGVALSTIAIKAAYKLPWWKAIAANVIPTLMSLYAIYAFVYSGPPCVTVQ